MLLKLLLLLLFNVLPCVRAGGEAAAEQRLSSAAVDRGQRRLRHARCSEAQSSEKVLQVVTRSSH